jgi:signal transduction histidine kinase
MLAASLVAVAVLMPVTVWYISGSRGVSRRAASLESEARLAAQRRVDRSAARLETRLESLRSAESERPFYHYQSLYHDPRGASDGRSVNVSPLAMGATNPLVWAHFQVDPEGQVSLPTVNDRFPELSSDAGFDTFCSFLAEIQEGLAVGEPLDGVLGDDPDGTADEWRLTLLEPAAWEQIRQAEAVYAELTGRGDPAALGWPRGDIVDDETVVVRFRPLRWHTMVLGSGPVLAALRDVVTPAGVVVQGFAVSPAAVAEWLVAGPRLVFGPDAELEQGQASSPIGATGWHLVTDARPELEAARQAGAALGRQFRGSFAVTAAAAGAAGLAVVLLVALTERLARHRARFAAGAAHELKTPLASLRLYSEMLAEDLGDPSRVRRYAAHIATETARLGRLVGNMLDLARLERGADVVRPSPGDLTAVVRECVDRLRGTLEADGLAVDLELPEHLPQSRFDRDALCQILDNLLDNARAHTGGDAGRRVTVAARPVPNAVEIEVQDTGPGVPSGVRRRLFTPFARHRNDGAGLGLGLAVARSLARAQGGDLVLAPSQPGAGASFVLSLPRAEPAS